MFIWICHFCFGLIASLHLNGFWWLRHRNRFCKIKENNAVVGKRIFRLKCNIQKNKKQDCVGSNSKGKANAAPAPFILSVALFSPVHILLCHNGTFQKAISVPTAPYSGEVAKITLYLLRFPMFIIFTTCSMGTVLSA